MDEDIEDIPEKVAGKYKEISHELFLFRLHTQLQKERVACDVRLSHLKKAGKTCKTTAGARDKLKIIEKSIAKDIEKTIEDSPVWINWAQDVRGIGKYLLGKAMAVIDIEKADTVSSLWKFAGLAPGQRRAKGQKLDFCMPLKVHCWKIAGSLIKAKGRYYLYYCEQKKRYTDRAVSEGKTIIKGKAKNDLGPNEENMLHIHLMAQRKMVKLWLSHFWTVWRAAAGLPVTKPYVHAIEGHDHYYEPFTDKGLEVVGDAE